MKKSQELLIAELPTDPLQLEAKPLQALAYGGVYALVFMLVLGLPMTFLPIQSPNVRVLLWLGGSILLGAFSGRFSARRAGKTRVAVCQEFLKTYDQEKLVLEIPWCQVEDVRYRGRESLLEFRMKDGKILHCIWPDLKATREERITDALIKSFRLDPEEGLKKYSRFSLWIAPIGLVLVFGFGRPRSMSQAFEGEFKLFDWVHTIGFALGILLLFGALAGVFAWLQVLDSSKKRQTIPDAEDVSQADEVIGWLKPIEMEIGKRYIYHSQDKLANSLKGSIETFWVIVVLMIVCSGGAFYMGFVSPHAQDKITTSVLALVTLAYLFGALAYLRVLHRRKGFLQDEMSVTENNLIITRGNVEFIYARVPLKRREDWPQSKTQTNGLVAVERFKGDTGTYEIDRRYLMEIPNQD